MKTSHDYTKAVFSILLVIGILGGVSSFILSEVDPSVSFWTAVAAAACFNTVTIMIFKTPKAALTTIFFTLLAGAAAYGTEMGLLTIAGKSAPLAFHAHSMLFPLGLLCIGCFGGFLAAFLTFFRPYPA